MYLFFNISAAGKPRNWKAPASDTFSWPRMAHLSWLLYNEERELVDSRNHLIKPVGYEVTGEMENKHKITQIQVEDEGVPIEEALMDFAEAIEEAEYVIAHNMNFHEKVIGAEFIRAGFRHGLDQADKYCLMQESTWFVKKKGADGKFKWPNLQELHTKLFEARYADSGNALADVSVTALAFFGLLDLEAIELF